MNSLHKKFSIRIFLFFSIIASAPAYSGGLQTDKYPMQICEKAKYGKINIKDISVTDSRINSYILDCALSVVIPEVSFKNGASRGNQSLKEKKKRIADYLLMQHLDITYKNRYGDNLLMSVISSFLPDSWKETAVAALIKKGINTKEKNLNGDTALDIAKFKNNKNIIKLLKQ